MLPQPAHHPIQPLLPKSPKSLVSSKPSYQRRAHGIIAPDKRPTQDMRPEDLITESAQRPDPGTIIETIDAGSNVAPLRVVMGIAPGQIGIAGAGSIPARVIVAIAAKQIFPAATNLMSVCIVVGIAAKEIFPAGACFMSVCIIIGITAEQILPAGARFMPLFIIMGITAKEILVAPSRFTYCFSSILRASNEYPSRASVPQLGAICKY